MTQEITACIRIRGDINSLNKAGIKFAEIVAKAWNVQVVDNRDDPKRDTPDYGVEIIDGDDIPVAFRVKYRDKWEGTLHDIYKRILLLEGTKGLIIDVDRYDLSDESGYSASFFGVKGDGEIDGIMTEWYGLLGEIGEGAVEATFLAKGRDVWGAALRRGFHRIASPQEQPGGRRALFKRF